MQIPDVAIYKEIPFIDGAEGVGYKIRSEQILEFPPAEWEAKRPDLICMDTSGWYETKLSWLRACRMAGARCDMEVQTIEDTIRGLDALAKAVLGGRR